MPHKVRQSSVLGSIFSTPLIFYTHIFCNFYFFKHFYGTLSGGKSLSFGQLRTAANCNVHPPMATFSSSSTFQLFPHHPAGSLHYHVNFVVICLLNVAKSLAIFPTFFRTGFQVYIVCSSGCAYLTLFMVFACFHMEN